MYVFKTLIVLYTTSVYMKIYLFFYVYNDSFYIHYIILYSLYFLCYNGNNYDLNDCQLTIIIILFQIIVYNRYCIDSLYYYY